MAAGLVFKDGKLLIAKRPENSHLGGMWEFPGGKLEFGESYEICLKREIEEELGIKIKVGYEFEDIKIDFGASRTFTLDNGINGGYDGVNVNVKFYCGARNWNGSVSKDFNEGENTTITVVDCFPNGQGGCTDVCYE